ncbi:MAG: hypothetical protein AMJ79_06445 [Phycisphaerae bacterium SM23_30]|nr:MAG: hypothetical protein AMJ79_06445 [Phycisphaerae bacterium SM23_30]
MKSPKRSRRGGSSILAVFFITLFAVLAISFTGMGNVNVKMARTHRDIAAAQGAAESGLAYAHCFVGSYIVEEGIKTFNNIVTDDDAFLSFYNLIGYIQDALRNSPLLEGQSLPNPVAFTEGIRTGEEFIIPCIIIDSQSRAGFTLSVKQYDDNPQNLIIISTGQMADVSRRLGICYGMIKDTDMLKFSVASKSPINITDDSTLGSGIYSDWRNPEIAPPITLSPISTIDGKVNTVMNESDFDDCGYTLEDVVLGTCEEINYDQPEVDLPRTEDFDTSMYAKETSVLSSGHTYNQKEYYPHAPGNYTQPVWGSVELNRTVYENMTVSDKRAIAGNALFKNCVFEGIFYIGTMTGIGTNNVRFENCTFNGPIITGVPPKFGIEEWKKNALYFTGDCVFNNTVMEEAAILAPNYNVDIGNGTGDSTLTGLVLGGVVDVRGDATIDGTVVSMANPLDLGELAGMLDTTVGISEQGGHTINITPSPDRMLPMGIKSKVLMIRDGNSYVELY